MTIEELEVTVTANTADIQKELLKSQNSIKGFEKQVQQSSNRITNAFKIVKTAIVALGIGKVVQSSVKSALDYIGNDTQYQATMGEWKNATRDFTDELKDKMGISRSTMRSFISTLYNTTTAMGVSKEASYKMSKSLSMLSQDMASFFNISADDALNKIQSGLTGNSTALKQLGILVNDTTVKDVAYRTGIARTGEELTEQQKVMARYTAIMQQTGNAQGYLANTMNSPNAQIRMLQDSVKTLSYTFGQLFIPVLQAVLPYLNAIAKLATRAVEAIARLFGIKTGDALTESMMGSAGGAGELADNVEDAGGGLADANKNAKKLKETLAGFDEMNVLTDNTADSAGSGGSSGGAGGAGDGDFALPEYDFSFLDNVTNKVDEIADHLWNAFNNAIDCIDWTNLLVSLQYVGQEGKRAFDTIVGAGKYMFSEVIAPLGKWSLENVLPTALMVVGSALSIVTSAFQILGSCLDVIYKNILKPVVNILGAVLEPVLKGIGKGAQDVGDVFKILADKVKECADKVNEFLKPVREWLDKVADWIRQNEALNAVLEGVGEVLGAFGMVLLVVTAAVAIWGVVSGAATVATTALGGAITFLTSPITLVIAAVAAVIAIVVLLVKHWDDVKAVAIKCWQEILDFLKPIGQWFMDNVVSPIMSVVTPIIDFFANVFTTIWEIISNVALLIIAIFAMIAEFIFSKVAMPILGFFKTCWDGISNGAKVVCDFITGVFGAIGNWLNNNVISPIAGFFEGLFNKIKNGFSIVKDFITNIFNGVKNTVSSIIDAIVSLIKLPINAIIDAVNFFIDGINKVKVPDWVPGVGGKGVNIPKIPKLATGGIIDRPTLAVVGEAGREAVMPLERNTGWIDELALRIGATLGGGNSNGEPVHVTVNIGEDTLIDKIVDGINDKMYQTNDLVFNL